MEEGGGWLVGWLVGWRRDARRRAVVGAGLAVGWVVVCGAGECLGMRKERKHGGPGPTPGPHTRTTHTGLRVGWCGVVVEAWPVRGGLWVSGTNGCVVGWAGQMRVPRQGTKGVRGRGGGACVGGHKGVDTRTTHAHTQAEAVCGRAGAVGWAWVCVGVCAGGGVGKGTCVARKQSERHENCLWTKFLDTKTPNQAAPHLLPR